MTTLVDLLFKANTKELDVAQSKLDAVKNSAKTASPAVDGVSNAFAKLANPVALATTAVIGMSAAFATLIVNTVKFADELGDLSEFLGITVEELSIMEKVARESGASWDTISNSLVKFTKAMGEAAEPTSEQARILKVLGLDGTASVDQVAKALDRYEAGVGKANATLVLFGKQGKEVNEWLHDYATRGDVAADITTKQAEEADKLNRAWNRLTSTMTSWATNVATPVIEKLSQIAGYLQSDYIKDIDAQVAANGDFGPPVLPYSGGQLAVPPAPKPKGGSKTPKAAKDDSVNGWSAYNDKSWGMTEAGYAEEQLKKIIELQARLQEQADEGSRSSEERWAKEVQGIEHLANPLLRYEEQMQSIRAAFVDGSISVETYDKAMNNVLHTMQNLGSKSKPIVDDMQQMFDQLTQAVEGYTQRMSDAMVDFAVTGKMSFSDLISSMLSDLAKMVMNQAFKQFIAMMGKGSPEGGIIGAIGNAFIGIFGAAEGGPIAGPTLVGERGPEIFVPNGAGTVIPNEMLGRSGGTQQINNISIVVKGGNTNNETGATVSQAVVNAMKAIAKNEIKQAQRPGGAANPMMVRG